MTDTSWVTINSGPRDAFPDTDVSWRLHLHDHVRVRDGRVGDVIGFYARVFESVLVRFSSGECDEFLVQDVALLS